LALRPLARPDLSDTATANHKSQVKNRAREMVVKKPGNDVERRILAALQGGLPRSRTPFADMAREVGITAGWQPQSHRLWGWLFRVEPKTIAKLRLTLPPGKHGFTTWASIAVSGVDVC
jgi:hypothetical protein